MGTTEGGRGRPRASRPTGIPTSRASDPRHVASSGRAVPPTENPSALLLPGPIEAPSDRDSYGAYNPLSCLGVFSTRLVRKNSNSVDDNDYRRRSLRRYGGERYEKRELQARVRERFAELRSTDEREGRVPWRVVDAGRSIEEVHEELLSIATEAAERVRREGTPLGRMWEAGEYELPKPPADGEGTDGEEKKEGGEE